MRVENRWKGAVASREDFLTGHGAGDCGVEFQRGQAYLIYLTSANSTMCQTSICSGTTPLNTATEDLRFLSSVKPK